MERLKTHTPNRLDLMENEHYRLCIMHTIIGRVQHGISTLGFENKLLLNQPIDNVYYEAYMEMKIAQMLEEHDIHTESYNVGCMHWNYEPVTLDEILAAGPQIISPPFR